MLSGPARVSVLSVTPETREVQQVEIYTDPATGRRYTVGADGRSQWLGEQQLQVVAAPGQPVVVVMQQPRPSTALQTTALVLGLLGFVTCGVASLVAVPVGHVALSQAKQRPGREGYGNALGGLILGWMVVGGGLAWLLFGVLYGAATGA